MAKVFIHFPTQNNKLSKMVHVAVLQIFMVVMAIAERCTRAVPRVQEYPAKKVHVLRRVPATCSNWDKAWSWLTKVDCGTKYRLDLVTVPSREVRQYKLQYVCCDGDTDCKEADNIQAPGLDTTDEKFLAIVLGSAAACVVIIIIIFAITFYTKKSRCNGICDQERHVYASAEVDDTEDNTEVEKRRPAERNPGKDYRDNEAEYAEISDPRLPRYTDIFKENVGDLKEDPFNKATAPPMYSPANVSEYTNSEMVASAVPTTSIKEVDASQRAAPEGGKNCQQSIPHSSDGDEAEMRYYNVRDKKKKKTQTSNSQEENSILNKEETKVVKCNNNSKGNVRTNSFKGKCRNPVSMEMMTKSSSASEGIGKMTEAALSKQNRRSAPSGSMDVSIGSSQKDPKSIRASSTSCVGRSNPSICTIIHESLPNPPRGFDKRSKATSSKEKLSQTSNSKSNKTAASKKSSSSSSASERKTSTSSLSNSKTQMYSSDDSTSKAQPPSEQESCQASESDSLLRSSSCHSCCGDDSTFDNCENCSKYDKVSSQPDPDAQSLHIYQCLDEVRQQVEELRAASAASSKEIKL